MLLGRAYRVGARLARACPPGLRYGIGGLAGAAFYTLDPFRHGAAARMNYAAVLGLSPGDPGVGRVMRRAAANYGKSLADFLLIGSLDPMDVELMMSHEGREHVDEALARGKGGILALPHMGSWDMCGALGGVWGYPLTAVAEPMPGSLNDVVVATRSRHGMRLIPLGRTTVREIGRALDENRLVALPCDLPHGAGVEVRFFGHQATLPAGPASFAIRHGCPVLPLYSWSMAPGHYCIHIDPPVEPPPKQSRPSREAVRELMQRVAERLEVFISQHPDQWYAFRPVLR